MEIPKEIQELISKGRDILNSSDEAALHYSFREDLYKQIEASQPTLATKIRGLLGLSAAQKVFPLSTPYSADFMDTLFEDAMAALHTYLGTQENEQELAELEDNLYHALGNWQMMYEDEEDFPVVPGKYAPSADYAGMALYKAIGEARGQRRKPFEGLGNVHQAGVVTVTGGVSPNPTLKSDEDITEALEAAGITFVPAFKSGTQFSELESAGLTGAGDAAGAATCAFAMIDEEMIVDKTRLATFWRWWLLEALPEIYRKL